jgi:hypothetical protein
MVARAEGNTYTAKVWDSSLVQGTNFCRPVPNPNFAIRNLVASLHGG